MKFDKKRKKGISMRCSLQGAGLRDYFSCVFFLLFFFQFSFLLLIDGIRVLENGLRVLQEVLSGLEE